MERFDTRIAQGMIGVGIRIQTRTKTVSSRSPLPDLHYFSDLQTNQLDIAPTRYGMNGSKGVLVPESKDDLEVTRLPVRSANCSDRLKSFSFKSG
jgi:hypothetical protein